MKTLIGDATVYFNSIESVDVIHNLPTVCFVVVTTTSGAKHRIYPEDKGNLEETETIKSALVAEIDAHHATV